MFNNLQDTLLQLLRDHMQLNYTMTSQKNVIYASLQSTPLLCWVNNPNLLGSCSLACDPAEPFPKSPIPEQVLGCSVDTDFLPVQRNLIALLQQEVGRSL